MRGTVAAVCIAFYVLGAMVTVSIVGKPREPLPGGVATFTVLTQAALALGVYYLWTTGNA